VECHPFNIPIKPPPRVNTANGVNGGSDDDGGRERERERERERGASRR